MARLSLRLGILPLSMGGNTSQYPTEAIGIFAGDVIQNLRKEKTMTRYNVTLEAEVSVSLSDPEKAKAYFIDGTWKDYFWKINDIDELHKTIAHAFYIESSQYDKELNVMVRSVEGFGTFVRQDDRSHVAEFEDYGKLTIHECYDLEPVDINESV